MVWALRRGGPPPGGLPGRARALPRGCLPLPALLVALPERPVGPEDALHPAPRGVDLQVAGELPLGSGGDHALDAHAPPPGQVGLLPVTELLAQVAVRDADRLGAGGHQLVGVGVDPHVGGEGHPPRVAEGGDAAQLPLPGQRSPLPRGEGVAEEGGLEVGRAADREDAGDGLPARAPLEDHLGLDFDGLAMPGGDAQGHGVGLPRGGQPRQLPRLL